MPRFAARLGIAKRGGGDRKSDPVVPVACIEVKPVCAPLLWLEQPSQHVLARK